jgi:hypothetical protein
MNPREPGRSFSKPGRSPKDGFMEQKQQYAINLPEHLWQKVRKFKNAESLFVEYEMKSHGQEETPTEDAQEDSQESQESEEPYTLVERKSKKEEEV